MKKIVALLVISLPLIIPGYTQEKKNNGKSEEPVKKEEKSKTIKEEKSKTITDDKIYQEVILEDFETGLWDNKNIKFRYTRDQEASLAVRDQFPSPSKGSKKYLGVKLKAKLGDFFIITPPNDIVIDKHCKSIAMWVYGKKFSGQISVLLQDAEKKNHRIILGTVDFLGWKKLSVMMPPTVKQEDEYLNQKKFIKIIQIQYRPGNQSEHPTWQYFYIDDITATVREKYTDRQSDDW